MDSFLCRGAEVGLPFCSQGAEGACGLAPAPPGEADTRGLFAGDWRGSRPTRPGGHGAASSTLSRGCPDRCSEEKPGTLAPAAQGTRLWG